MISSGSVSAASTTNSAIPLFNALVVSLAPFLICLVETHWFIKSNICLESALSALGHALDLCS